MNKQVGTVFEGALTAEGMKFGIVCARFNDFFVSKLLDGVIMVVRGNYVTRRELAEAMRQLKLVNVRILGFAYRGVSEHERNKKYREYKKTYEGHQKKKHG